MEFAYTLTTDKTMEQAVLDVKERLQELKFGTLWEFNIPAKLKEKGVDFQGNATVLEVCNPVRAKEALEHNMNVVYFLPCKIVVYEEKGQTKIGMVRLTVFMDLLKDKHLKDFAQEVEDTLKLAMDRAI